MSAEIKYRKETCEFCGKTFECVASRPHGRPPINCTKPECVQGHADVRSGRRMPPSSVVKKVNVVTHRVKT